MGSKKKSKKVNIKKSEKTNPNKFTKTSGKRHGQEKNKKNRSEGKKVEKKSTLAKQKSAVGSKNKFKKVNNKGSRHGKEQKKTKNSNKKSGKARKNMLEKAPYQLVISKMWLTQPESLLCTVPISTRTNVSRASSPCLRPRQPKQPRLSRPPWQFLLTPRTMGRRAILRQPIARSQRCSTSCRTVCNPLPAPAALS